MNYKEIEMEWMKEILRDKEEYIKELEKEIKKLKAELDKLKSTYVYDAKQVRDVC